ncbi:MAG: hypothetical protein P8M77_03815 [Porticoccaceae bacterium]|nr:hypothetical protein [Porticoccaceae bacterium]
MTNQTIENLQKDLQELENNTQARDIFRLAQARNKALSQSSPKQRKSFFPVLGASMASILLVSFFFFQEAPTSLNDEFISDLNPEEPLFEMDDENLDLYEDLDFYYWLANNDQGATG